VHTTQIGNQAEQKAAEYLERRGYEIVDRNWRRRDCEIDVVAQRNDAIYFVEVKYRSTDGSGSGLEYITASKLRRMEYGANRWVQEHHWSGEFLLSAIEVSGDMYEITSFLESLTQ
jgi:putative endonuclease